MLECIRARKQDPTYMIAYILAVALANYRVE